MKIREEQVWKQGGTSKWSKKKSRIGMRKEERKGEKKIGNRAKSEELVVREKQEKKGMEKRRG